MTLKLMRQRSSDYYSPKSVFLVFQFIEEYDFYAITLFINSLQTLNRRFLLNLMLCIIHYSKHLKSTDVQQVNLCELMVLVPYLYFHQFLFYFYNSISIIMLSCEE